MKKFKISIQPTNDPSIIKFEANHFILNHESYEYANIDEAKNSPLAQQLFYLPFVRTVYISGNFIAIKKYEIIAWEDVQNEVAEQVKNYLNSGQQVVLEAATSSKNPVTVYAESTPNPAVMKFVANKNLVISPFEFKNIEEAKDAALVKALFHFPFVKEVFLDANYIAITKYDIAEWNDIAMELREFIRNFIAEGKEIIAVEKVTASTASSHHATQRQESLDDTSKEIIAILDEYVKPAVASDGGNIIFDAYDASEKTVKVILQGACSGCPSSTFTLKNGIETMLKNMLHDKVNEVIAVNG
ncbi:MAG: NifU family protein [Bacteroidota bacterium]